MVQYRISNLLNHLQRYIKSNNPNHGVIAAEHVAWIHSSRVLSAAYKEAWKDTEIPLLASRSFPGSSSRSLGVCLEYLIACILLEQLTDAPANTIQARKWADIYKQAFSQTLKEKEGPAAIIKDSVDQVLNAIEDPYRSPLVESNVLLAEGMVNEAADREKPDTRLTVETYMKVRRDTIGVRPFLHIGRWIYGIDIAHEVLMHPEILKLEEQVSDLVSLANDLYSYKREFLTCGAHHNIVTVALRDPVTRLPDTDRQGAIDYTCRKFCQVLANFEQRSKTLPSFGASEDAKIAMYVGVMMDIVVGNIQWSLECERYGHSKVVGTAEAPNWGDVVFDMDPL